MITATFDGTTLLVYDDGSLVTPSSTPTDVAGPHTLTDLTRAVYMGVDPASTVATRWQGLVHKTTIWSRPLLSAEITEIFNTGSGSTFVELKDGITYAGASEVLHHWDFRQSGNTSLGQDYGNRAAASRWNLTDNSLNVTSADLVATVPT